MREFDVVIIGGGVSGCAAFYVLSEYTNVKSIAIVDKCDKWANISSSSKANSQTIHDGSIETNYTAEKAKKVRLSALKVRNYALQKNLQNKVIFEDQKMAIGIGDKECDVMKQRYEDFLDVFPDMQFFDKQKIKLLEPKVIEGYDGRDRFEDVVGMGYEKAWCAMNFGLLSEHFIEEGMNKGKENQTFLNFWVKKIEPRGDGYAVISKENEEIYAKFVLVDAGSYALPLAQSMGYGMDLGCLPVAGSFYFVPDLLRGKVYTVQNPKLPFAALHGDPDVVIKGKTRIGPTALAMPKLERGKHWYSKLSLELLKLDLNMDVMKIAADLLMDKEIRDYVIKNMIFEMPYIGKRKFLKDARKIIPSLRLSDLHYAEGFGEVRPQVLDRKARKLVLGEKKIATQRGITFNMTPSPGATSCLQNAMIDAEEIVQYLQCNFEKERFLKELCPEELDA
ncbi:FAD-dependent oxidoreductase [Helicobacter mustelae]|uniref:malate dehydrogenase (quinone) n=1 Tax=Helicobacter mustelae (strain ATCC 43772 / CCUG 25715 / CIP 103759 / LMG 18044 / NCTC 12198 / R85-136P) TaxID=679897 RepID=D3UHK6_HELM1|nr:FAD-dependent oxidoreductase [Helicobacter mustelae]CBG39978.1 putative Malate:quinone oxidoreductase [Helicobacter mustelae 12198]SQH71492.1 Malate:quinone oxidoreductase [Helicobacter mustelae]STP12618.1 Malate:quinone oxidoreductase [Helicobacter mustelae]